MAEENKSKTSEDIEKKEDAKVTEEEDKTKSEEDDKAGDSSKEDKELDEALEKERKNGEADPEKAKEAFQKRETKRKEKGGDDEGEEEDLDDLDKPVTRREAMEIEQRGYRRAQQDRARELANNLATSPKEAELIFLKWQNRTFPTNLSLQEQIEEAYAITNVRKFAGERNEALRAIRGKSNASKATEGDHRAEPQAGEPKLSDSDKQAYAGAGFVWDGAKRLYKKPLGKGKFLYKDQKTGRQWRE